MSGTHPAGVTKSHPGGGLGSGSELVLSVSRLSTPIREVARAGGLA